MNIKDSLVSLLTRFDERESKKKNYNRYALGIYLQRADSVLKDIEMGAKTRAAIVAGFNGRLGDFILRGLKLPVTTEQEQIGGGWAYRPVSKGHPDA